jgi:PAS domain-containing protein
MKRCRVLAASEPYFVKARTRIGPCVGLPLDSARDPERLALAEADVGQSGGEHHFFDLTAGKPLLQTRSETVEGIGPHRVEACRPIGTQRPIGHIAAELLRDARRPGERPVESSREFRCHELPDRKWQARNSAPQEITPLPEPAEPGGPLVECIIELDEKGRSRLELADAIRERAPGVRYVVQDAERVAKVLRTIVEWNRGGVREVEPYIWSVAKPAPGDIEGSRRRVDAMEQANAI